MEKRPCWAWPRLFFTLTVYVICVWDPTARRRLMTERSERMSEEAENHLYEYFALSRRGFYVSAE